MKESDTDNESQWQKTPVANLVRNTASKIYYARVRVRGKLIWKSLKTSFSMLEQVTLGAPWRIRMAKQFEDLIVAQAPATRYSPSPKAPVDVAPGQRVGGKPEFHLLPPRARGGTLVAGAKPVQAPKEGLNSFGAGRGGA